MNHNISTKWINETIQHVIEQANLDLTKSEKNKTLQKVIKINHLLSKVNTGSSTIKIPDILNIDFDKLTESEQSVYYLLIHTITIQVNTVFRFVKQINKIESRFWDKDITKHIKYKHLMESDSSFNNLITEYSYGVKFDDDLIFDNYNKIRNIAMRIRYMFQNSELIFAPYASHLSNSELPKTKSHSTITKSIKSIVEKSNVIFKVGNNISTYKLPNRYLIKLDLSNSINFIKINKNTFNYFKTFFQFVPNIGYKHNHNNKLNDKNNYYKNIIESLIEKNKLNLDNIHEVEKNKTKSKTKQSKSHTTLPDSGNLKKQHLTFSSNEKNKLLSDKYTGINKLDWTNLLGFSLTYITQVPKEFRNGIVTERRMYTKDVQQPSELFDNVTLDGGKIVEFDIKSFHGSMIMDGIINLGILSESFENDYYQLISGSDLYNYDTYEFLRLHMNKEVNPTRDDMKLIMMYIVNAPFGKWQSFIDRGVGYQKMVKQSIMSIDDGLFWKSILELHNKINFEEGLNMREFFNLIESHIFRDTNIKLPVHLDRHDGIYIKSLDIDTIDRLMYENEYVIKYNLRFDIK